MAKRLDAVGLFAEKMVAALASAKATGGAGYPVSLKQLAASIDSSVSAETVLKAAKKPVFKTATIVAGPVAIDSPVALQGDAQLLAESDLLMAFLCEQVFSAAKPTCEIKKLVGKAPKPLQPAFAASVARRIESGQLPAGIVVVAIKKQRLLHAVRYPLPLAPEVQLAQQMLLTLRRQKETGDLFYPLALSHLIELTCVGVAKTPLSKALKVTSFNESVLIAINKDVDSPVALVEDMQHLCQSDLLLERVMELLRKDDNSIFPVSDISKKVVKVLQPDFGAALRERALTLKLPSSIGCLYQKKKVLLFFVRDVAGAKTASTRAVVDFAAAFEIAFDKLDYLGRSHNHVSLVDLRREISVDRPTFDAGLRELRLAQRFTLSAAEGRDGVTEMERNAGIVEDGSLLLFVSKKVQ